MVQQTATPGDQPQDNTLDNAVAEGGAYEIIRKRLIEQGKQLHEETSKLNQARLEEFGSSEMSVIGRIRVRTENNCIARDMVQVGEHLLFGYNVFIGLKKETSVDDVFALFTITRQEGNFDITVADTSTSLYQSFLAHPSFVNDFDELYRYYKQTRLIQLSARDGKILACFQIGERPEDIRVFRWSISADGKTIDYIDNRGERDIQLPPSYDFEWQETSREDTIHGRHSHVNILDTLFVETIGGDLTLKIENNTEDGLGIYREAVDDKTQSIDDARFLYAEVGDLILLKVLPYREEQWRYFIFNKLTESVTRIDALGESCIQLPEDHGVIFPGGYYLQSGEHKLFEDCPAGLKFKRMIRSPNGEDVLYIFYEPIEGLLALFPYNMIEKSLQNPIIGHGYALAENGELTIFSAEEEPTRVHPMQIWQTPYESAEYASKAPTSQSFLGKIGNAELVRGVSDLYSICRIIENQSVSARLYEELQRAANKLFDDHYWVDSSDGGQSGKADSVDSAKSAASEGAETRTLERLAPLLREISSTAELVIDEFEKVQSIRQQSIKTMQEAEAEQESLVSSIRPENWETAEEYVNALGSIRHQRGHLITIKSLRYIDLPRLEEMDQQLQKLDASLTAKTVEFLSDEQSLSPYHTKIETINQEIEAASKIVEINPIIEQIESTTQGLDLLSELMGTLKVDDATVQTRIIDAISQVYSTLNQSKANAKHKQKSLGSAEAHAQFAAQFKLFSQSITNALSLANSPEKCDEQLSRLLMQLEELESQFSEFDEYLGDIMDKREELYESFESHKQQLLDERQRKAQSLTDAASRILSSIEKRSLKFTEADDLNTFFASDGLVMKVRELSEQLRELQSAVKADDIDARFKAMQDQALRALRDKTDIYEAGGNIIKLGPRHKFSVNTQELDLTIIPREDDLYIHLTGTDYFEPISNDELLSLKPYWSMSLASESETVYRGEYLAALILEKARQHEENLSIEQLRSSLVEEGALQKIVQGFSNPRYKEGYIKGIHDLDATQLLTALIPTLDRADLLAYDPQSRAIAQLYWLEENKPATAPTWIERAQSAQSMLTQFGNHQAITLLVKEIETDINAFTTTHALPFSPLDIQQAAAYLVAELGRDRLEFINSKYGTELVEDLQRTLSTEVWRNLTHSLEKLSGYPREQWLLTTAWLNALTEQHANNTRQHYIPEAAALLIAGEAIPRRHTEVDLQITVTNLMGEHSTLRDRSLSFTLDQFLKRMEHHQRVVIPAYHRYLDIRQQTIAKERSSLRLEEFKPRPLASFVRNRLINESYLPLIGDNLAKQMGTVGENKRSDLMGLLMMISPPGYGKTTLMEYVASRLGLIFMKINCPSLGHDVVSLDPQQAPNATAKQELDKLNLALEMGNNVMLYLDDIQHTHPEFLQKFISLCDGTRRIEGVWRSRTKTYDMRGKKFCVVMAGNPYTESGEAFKVPDMLANRADIYNLGDILGGMEEPFALSYIENAMTSNPVLAPLAVRDMGDIYRLIDMAKGKEIATSDLKHQYSGAEINEITEIIKKMLIIQDVILKINQQYIASAAQDDKYRTEPAFKLQGSYRNMNKMTEKISSVMNQDELMQLINDHYLGESQLLTTGAEANLLKLAELRGLMSEAQKTRWEQIKSDFMRNKAMGGDDADTGDRVVAQLVDMVKIMDSINTTASESATQSANIANDRPSRADFLNAMKVLTHTLKEHRPSVEVTNQPVPGINKILEVLANTIEQTIFPVVRTMDKKLDIDLQTHEKMGSISKQIKELERFLVAQRKGT